MNVTCYLTETYECRTRGHSPIFESGRPLKPTSPSLHICRTPRKTGNRRLDLESLSGTPAPIAILGTVCRLAWLVASSCRLMGVYLNESDYRRMMAVEWTFGEFEQTDYHDLILATPS